MKNRLFLTYAVSVLLLSLASVPAAHGGAMPDQTEQITETKAEPPAPETEAPPSEEASVTEKPGNTEETAPLPVPDSAQAETPEDQTADIVDAVKQGLENPKKIPRAELSLATAILFALNSNPDIEIAREREVQQKHTIEEAKAAFYPSGTLSLEAGHEYNKPAAGKNSGRSDNNNAYNINISTRQLLFDGDTAREKVLQQKQILASTALQTDITTEDIMTETIREYLNILYQQQTLPVNYDLVNKLEDILNRVTLMQQAGDASQAKVEYAKSRLAFAKTRLTENYSSLNNSISSLEALTGRLPPFYATYPEGLDTDLYSFEDYLIFAKTENSEMQLNRSDAEALRHQLRSEKGKFFPSVNFKIEADRKVDDGGNTGNISELKALFDVQFTLFDGGARKAKARRIASQINEQDIQRRKIIKDLTKEIKTAHNQLSSIKQSIIATEDEIESSRALQKLNEENYEFGNIDIIELIEGEERLSLAEAKKHKLISDYFFSMHELTLLVGLLKKNYFCASC